MEEPAFKAATPEKEMFKQKELNLITIASLAQWSARVINRIGSEHFGTLVELSSMTERISPEVKEVLLVLVPLLEGRDSGSGLAAKDLVALLAQLDGLLGNTSSEEARLLPFLLPDDLEVLPLIRP